MTSLTYQNQTASKSLFQAGFVGRPRAREVGVQQNGRPGSRPRTTCAANRCRSAQPARRNLRPWTQAGNHPAWQPGQLAEQAAGLCSRPARTRLFQTWSWFRSPGAVIIRPGLATGRDGPTRDRTHRRPCRRAWSSCGSRRATSPPRAP